jgi:hypothetical protein
MKSKELIEKLNKRLRETTEILENLNEGLPREDTYYSYILESKRLIDETEKYCK